MGSHFPGRTLNLQSPHPKGSRVPNLILLNEEEAQVLRPPFLEPEAKLLNLGWLRKRRVVSPNRWGQEVAVAEEKLKRAERLEKVLCVL